MSVYAPVTPQRQLPGHYIQTPAPNQTNLGQQAQHPELARGGSQFGSLAGPPSQQQNGALVQSSGQAQPPAQTSTTTSTSLSAAQRAAKAINESLQQDARYPAFDDYVSQGISADYEITSDPALAPFQRVKMYEIPDRVFEQYNQAQLHTMMGLFAELHHAWVAIDNALYLWDYTAPNPELIGFEEQPHTIMAVKLVRPRAGVFVKAITHLLVVATTSDIFLIGLATEETDGGVITVQLYQTKMQVSIKGIDVSHIAGDEKSGRIFFGGRSNNDVWELAYQQEEKWFSNRCAKVNHTTKGVSSILPALEWKRGPPEHMTQIVADTTRNLVYTLSNTSTIRVFHMSSSSSLDLAVTETLQSIITRTQHMVARTELLHAGQTGIVSLNPIHSREAARLALIGTTNTGCRIVFSATSGSSYYSSDPSGPPRSFAIHHIFFPPTERQANGQQLSSSYGTAQQVDTNSRYLTGTYEAFRFSPGFFLFTLRPNSNVPSDNLFLSCPDPGRLASRPDAQQGSQKLIESGITFNMNGIVQDVGLTTGPFQASNQPLGFGNELAVQYSQPVAELAVLTSTGIQTIRRRRLVDLFAALLRTHKMNDEMIEDAVNSFVRLYGRAETMATTLAVACGQAMDVTTDGARVAQITDPEVVDAARKVFVTQGGKPVLNENAVVDRNTAPTVENVSPSPRYYGMTRYIARLLRSLWTTLVVVETPNPTGGLLANPSVPLERMRDIQRDLSGLQEFLATNKNSIDGLAGPEALGRTGSKQEEMALQGEHRALHSLVKLIDDVIEGISFVLVLFDNRVNEILLSLPDQSRQLVRQLTFETLFTSDHGKDLAKELVKAIVQRNIAAGSNVETVAESLRRKCGNFCSADDVIIFKAQESLKRAEEAGKESDTGRRQLNESLRLFERVAGNLRMEILRPAVEKYVALEFWAGSLELVLEAAKQIDRANRASSWVKDGSPEGDERKGVYEKRKACYDLIHEVIEAVDSAVFSQPPSDFGVSKTRQRRDEAYTIIDDSTDELFQTNMYDWYLERGWADRLLDIRAPFVVNYLQRKSLEDPKHADLLWRYYAHYSRYFEAGTVQLQLAKSGFPLTLASRIEYLSRAKANASTRTGVLDGSFARSSAGRGRQETIREITDLLDLAGVQEDLWSRLAIDPRLPADKKPEIENELNGEIKSLDELYNNYIDQASYFDLALLIFPLADHRNPTDIASTWSNLIAKDHTTAIDNLNSHNADVRGAAPQPWESVVERVRELGRKLQLSEVYFPVGTVLPLLARYHVSEVLEGNAITASGTGPSPTWVPSLFIDLGVPYESIVAALESVFYSNEAPFTNRGNRGLVGAWLVYAASRWLQDSSVDGLSTPFGSIDNAVAVAESVRGIEGAGVLGARETEEARRLRARIESSTR